MDPLYGVKMGRDASVLFVWTEGSGMYVVGIDVGMYDVIAVPRLDRSVGMRCSWLQRGPVVDKGRTRSLWARQTDKPR